MTETYDGPFSLLQMFWGSITARPLRSFLSVIAIAIQVILVLMIVGLTSGIISEWGKRVEGVGADILVQPPNSSIFFAFVSVGMQESLGEQIQGLSGVDEVAPTDFATVGKNGAGYGLVVLDGWLPTTLPPGNYLVFNTESAATPLLATGGDTDSPAGQECTLAGVRSTIAPRGCSRLGAFRPSPRPGSTGGSAYPRRSLA